MQTLVETIATLGTGTVGLLPKVSTTIVCKCMQLLLCGFVNVDMDQWSDFHGAVLNSCLRIAPALESAELRDALEVISVLRDLATKHIDWFSKCIGKVERFGTPGGPESYADLRRACDVCKEKLVTVIPSLGGPKR